LSSKTKVSNLSINLQKTTRYTARTMPNPCLSPSGSKHKAHICMPLIDVYNRLRMALICNTMLSSTGPNTSGAWTDFSLISSSRKPHSSKSVLLYVIRGGRSTARISAELQMSHHHVYMSHVILVLRVWSALFSKTWNHQAAI
jgi:hypothetical protein